MDTARYVVAVMILLSFPIAVGLWYVIHPFARLWRRIGPAGTYLILAIPTSLAVWLLWRVRDRLLGADLGTQPALFVLAIPSIITAIALVRLRLRQLTPRILAGVPELSRQNPGRLLTEGIYAKVRNPRYLEILLFLLAYVAFANFAGTWILLALSFPALHGVVLLEERELRDRFGPEYEAYCRRVPRYIPRRFHRDDRGNQGGQKAI